MKKKRKFLKIFLVILVPILIIWILVSIFTRGAKDTDAYELIQPQASDTIVKTTILTGSIQPRDLVPIKPQMSGIISEILKKPGDHVKVGDLIAKVSIVPDLGMVQNALSRLESARIQYEHQKQLFEREKLLYEKKVSSEEQFQGVKTQYMRSENELKSAEDALEIARTGSSSSTRKANNTMIRATVAGLILEQPVKVGQSVIQANNFNEGTTIVSIADLNNLLFVGNANETDVNKIDIGSPVTVKIGALPDLSIPAQVEYISPKGVESRGAVMFEVKAALQIDKNQSIKAGFSSNAEIVTDKAEGILTIPEKCILYDADTPYVFVQKGSGNKASDFEKRDISLGVSDGVKVEIKSGLNPEDKVRGSHL